MENRTPFDLSEAIRRWQQNLGASPALSADNLEELASRLRASVQKLQADGLSEKEAFLAATRRLGERGALEREFAKVAAGRTMRRLAFIVPLLVLFGALLASRDELHSIWLWIFAGVTVVVLVCQGIIRLRVAALRRAGIYPAAGQGRMADVERLVRAGHRVWAIRCYREIHHCGLADAKKAVEALHIAR
jgi:hypothetical protein